MKSLRFIAVCLLSGLLSPIACLAQSPPTPDSWRSVSGRVLFAENNQPAERVRVELKLLFGNWSATAFTDRGGLFEYQGLPVGTYLVTVSAPECESLVATAQFDAGSAPLLFRLRKAPAPPPTANRFVVSVKELSIPSKARKAFDKGTRLLRKGNSAASVPYFERAVAESPAFYKAYYNLGVAQLRLGRLTDAAQAFQKSIDLSADGFGLPHFALGLILCEQQEFPAAVTIIQRGLDLEPGSAAGKYFLALAQFGLNRLPDAEKSVQQALLRKAHFASAYLLLAKIHMRLNNNHALMADVEAYLKLDPKSPGSAEARVLREKAQRALAQSAGSPLAAEAEP